MEHYLSKVEKQNGDREPPFPFFKFSFSCLRVCVCVFTYFIYFILVFIFNLTYVLLKFIKFIIYFIVILFLFMFLKKWGIKMQKILKKIIQEQNRKSEKKEKRTKIKQNYNMNDYRRSPSKVFLGNCVLKICSKCTGEHPYRSLISIKLQSMGGLR